MNRRAEILQKAKLREAAARAAYQAQHNVAIVQMMAEKLDENGLTFFVTEDGYLAFAIVKHVSIIH